jgi:hypothetical protein
MRRLQLGPIVGHTDTQSTRIWIRVFDDPALYELRVTGVGRVPFISTESALEFGTAIAVMSGLRSDWRYHYQVLRRGRNVPGARGSFRTMPPDNSMAEIQFAFVSCNHQKNEGSWAQLRTFIEDSQPRFLLMMAIRFISTRAVTPGKRISTARRPNADKRSRKSTRTTGSGMRCA